jgi:hypothetical protein
MAHYQVSIEGSLDAATRTPAATGADWDQALKDARERSIAQEHNHTVRYVDNGRARIIATLVGGEIVWPRLASPVVDLRTRDLEAG